jgi:hypothetical protein
MYTNQAAMKGPGVDREATDARGVTRGARLIGERLEYLEKAVEQLYSAIGSIMGPEPPMPEVSRGPALAAPFGSELATTLDGYAGRIGHTTEQIQSYIRRIEL